MSAFALEIPNKWFPYGAALENFPTFTLVVAALIHGPDGRYLLQRRPHGKDHAGLWEFPGGKVEAGESPRIALIRELKEELGLHCDSASMMPLGFADRASIGSQRAIAILLYTVECPEQQAIAHEGGELGWFLPGELRALAMPPLDIDLLDCIGLAGKGA